MHGLGSVVLLNIRDKLQRQVQTRYKNIRQLMSSFDKVGAGNRCSRQHHKTGLWLVACFLLKSMGRVEMALTA